MKRQKPMLDPDLLARLAEHQAAVEPPAGLAARLKARVLAEARAQAEVPAAAPVPVTVRATEGEWVRLAPKVEMRVLRQDSESRSFLLRLAPGAVLAPHDHPIDEECYVLEGEVRFGGIQVSAGDYHLAPRGARHGLVRSRRGALLLLRGATPDEEGLV